MDNVKVIKNIDRVRKARESILISATLLFTGAYSWQIISPPTGIADFAINGIIYVTWIVFALDYLYGLFTAETKGKWFIRHIPELLILVVPAVRSLRLIRFLGLIVIFQRIAGSNIRGKVIGYIVSLSLILLYLISLAILDAERGQPNASIQNFGDALWWSFATMTTVGYGDLTPVTVQGRIIAVALMIGGIGLLGIVTATLASWLMEQIETEVMKAEKSQSERMQAMENELREIKALLILNQKDNSHPAQRNESDPS
jgi:voltage-gated potassium channel